jgi:DNA recombination protein RmuC
MELSTVFSLALVLALGLVLGALLGALWARARSASTISASVSQAERLAIESRAADQALVQEGLQRLHDRMRDLDASRISWQSQLKQQVDEVRHSTDLLRRETSSLSTALRKPQVRGRWGELHLRRAVELAGLVSRCDFSEQVTVDADGARLRPDMVVNLAGGKSVVVDAKGPLDASLDATGADSDDERDAHLARHARQLRQHVDALSAKAYWRYLSGTPEFVVLFVPGESFLSAALEADGGLLEYAAGRQVLLATPTTLIALLRTVAYAWTQETLADRARDISTLGRELYDRIALMGGHLDKLGRSLNTALDSYNAAIGSLETRVLVTARRFVDMEVSADELESPRPVAQVARPLSAVELVAGDETPARRGATVLDPRAPTVAS